MQPIERALSSNIHGGIPPSTLSSRTIIQGPVTAQMGGGRAILEWTPSVTPLSSGPIEASIDIPVGNQHVRLTLSVAVDGPTLDLLYGSHEMPVPFDDFRLYVSSEKFVRMELGGSSHPEGFKFSSPPLDLPLYGGLGRLRFEVPIAS